MPQLDKYELVEELGHGGMATVYRGSDRRLERDVAVKIIHRHLRENEEVMARFVSEAKAVAKVKHPNIVEVYDVSMSGDSEHYLVVELVRGCSLRKLLVEHGHMPPEVAMSLVLEVTAGLHHAHMQGVIHRDVKPENVLVGPPAAIGKRQSLEVPSRARYALIKITDFGIAKLLDAQGVTSTGQVLGSPAHMSPEQIEGGDVDVRADVFGVGVLLYECVVGALPFVGKNPAQVLRKVLEGSYVAADRARPSVGTGLSRIIDRALARNPEERFANVDALSQAIAVELNALGFDDPRRELAEYVSEPSRYWESFTDRIIKRLVKRGTQARKEGDAATAAAAFNRALAYRPDDVELLGQVAQLARRRRLKRSAVQLGGALLGLLVAGAGVYIATEVIQFEQPAAEASEPVEGQDRPEPNPEPKNAAELPPEPAASPAPPPAPTATMEAESTVSRSPARPQPTPEAPTEPTTRGVRVSIPGVHNAKLELDGERQAWFGRTLELETGEHTFQAIPPDETCCFAPPPQQVHIEPGEGLQHVSLDMRFRPATLSLRQLPSGSEVVCGRLGRITRVRHHVKMTGPRVEIECTIDPPGAADIRTVPVELQAGKEFALSWP